MNNIVQKISTSENIDLSLLTVKELERLHFEEESYAAQKIRATKPFSDERNAIMKTGYELVSKIMHERALKQGSVKHAFGASQQCTSLIKKIIRRYRKNRQKEKIVYYEAGVGTGLVVNGLYDDNDVIIKGCDVYLTETLKSNPRFEFFEGTIFDALSYNGKLCNEGGGGNREIIDNSIDIFYWNDVMEHILDDEINTYMKLIHRKIADNGIIITITPNRFVGPSDISRLFCSLGTAPKGFHFHEYSYYDVKTLFYSYGFQTDCCVLMNPTNRKFFIGSSSLFGITLIDILRRIGESFAPFIYPLLARKVLLYGLGTHVTVFKKLPNNFKKEEK